MSSKYKSGQFADPKGIVVQGPTMDYGMLAEGGTIPTDGTAGYEEGCLFLVRGSTALGGLQLYVNEGTNSSCDFNPIWQVGNTPVNVTAAALTVTPAAHGNRWVTLNRATGVAVTLPAFAGLGLSYRFFIGTATSGGTQVFTATGAFLFGGIPMNTDTGAGNLFTCVAAANAGGSTTITLDGSTKGGRKGDWVEIIDVGTNVGLVRGMLNGSGTEDTPFS